MAVKVNLASRDNGAGLTTDMAILEEVCSGRAFDVMRLHWREPMMRLCDVAFHLELWNSRLAKFARANIGVFNLEWFMPTWKPYLPTFTQIWAKSMEAYDTYHAVMSRPVTNVVYTGFASRDMNVPTVEREVSVFHLRGHSQLKGTDAVIEAWRRHYEDLPPLTIVSSVPFNGPPNSRVLTRQTKEDLALEMNRAAIHLCPSETEGWGHYIAEGLSVGAVVITTDASPMNEHVHPGWGYLLPATDGPVHDLARLHRVDPEDIYDAVRAAASLPAGVRKEMGERAQSHFHYRNREFRKLALDLLGGL